jgi:hypothetical protein
MNVPRLLLAAAVPPRCPARKSRGGSIYDWCALSTARLPVWRPGSFHSIRPDAAGCSGVLPPDTCGGIDWARGRTLYKLLFAGCGTAVIAVSHIVGFFAMFAIVGWNPDAPNKKRVELDMNYQLCVAGHA